MKKKIFKAADKNFIQKLFENKKKLFFPSTQSEISEIQIEKISPFWAKETCLARYKIFFGKEMNIIRGSAKTSRPNKETWKIMKYLYSAGFNKGNLLVAEPVDFIEELNLILYKETPGLPLGEVLLSQKPKTQEIIRYLEKAAGWLRKLHTLSCSKKKFRRALFLGKEKYIKIFKKINWFMPDLKDYLPQGKNLEIIDEIWRKEKKSLIHNDFYPGNFIIGKGKFYGIDFDRSGIGPQLMDVAALYGFLEFPKEIWKPNLSEKEIKILQEGFLKTYCKIIPLNYPETRIKLKKFLAKIYLDQVHYYAALAFKGWRFLDNQTKEDFATKIKSLLLKMEEYLS